MIQPGNRRAVRHGSSDCSENRLFGRRSSPFGQTGEGRGAGTSASGGRCDPRRASREEAAKAGGMDRQTLRDWVIRFNEQGPDGLINIASPGAPAKLDEEHKAFLARIVDEGPTPAIHGVVRWRACDLIMRLYEEFALSVSDDTIYRAMKELGFSHVSARPKAYKQDAEAMDAFKKTFPHASPKSARSSHRAHR